MSWDEASERRLTELWGAGWSATLIGAEIGQTRNAVIGKAHRMKLPRRRSSVNALERTHKAAAARSHGRRSQFGQPSGPGVLRRAAARAAGVSGAVYGGAPSTAVPAAREPGTAEERPRELFASTAAAVVGLWRAECRWPIGDPKSPGFGFCGQAAEEGRSYCAAHRQRATRLLPEALG